MSTRIGWIDTAKGIGIFLVVFGHALPQTHIVATILWAFHMPLFFFLSGVTAKAWAPGGGQALMRGLKNLVVPYLFFSLVSICLWSISKGSAPGSQPLHLLTDMAYGVAGPQKLMDYNVPLWFFTCLVAVRLLFAAIIATCRSKPLQFACTLLVAVTAHLVVFPNFISVIWNADLALVALVFFTAGYGMQQLSATPSAWSSGWKSLAGIAALVLLAVSVSVNGRVDMNGRVFGDLLWFYVGAFSGIALMIGVAHRVSGLTFLKTLGSASIVIFPTHALFWLLPSKVFSVTTWYAWKITHSDVLASAVIACTEIVLCLPLYFAIGRWAPFLIGQAMKVKPVSRQDVAQRHASLTNERREDTAIHSP